MTDLIPSYQSRGSLLWGALRWWVVGWLGLLEDLVWGHGKEIFVAISDHCQGSRLGIGRPGSTSHGEPSFFLPLLEGRESCWLAWANPPLALQFLSCLDPWKESHLLYWFSTAVQDGTSKLSGYYLTVSGIWTQLVWVVLAQDLFWSCSQDIGWGYCHLKAWPGLEDLFPR